MKTALLCGFIAVSVSSVALAKDLAIPAFVNSDQSGALKAAYDLTYHQRKFEINLGARATRTIVFSEDAEVYRSEGKACLYGRDVDDVPPPIQIASPHFTKVCEAAGGTAVVDRLNMADTNNRFDMRVGGSVFCYAKGRPMFKATVEPLKGGFIGNSCPGLTSLQVVVPKPGSTALKSDFAATAERVETGVKLVQAAEREAVAKAKAQRDGMARVSRGDLICNDTISRFTTYSAYVEEVAGPKLKVLIQGTSSGSYYSGNPKPQELHWVTRADWRLCN